MLSRLTASAAMFAVLSAATITFAAGPRADVAAVAPTAAATPVVQLQTVLVIGKRTER